MFLIPKEWSHTCNAEDDIGYAKRYEFVMFLNKEQQLQSS